MRRTRPQVVAQMRAEFLDEVQSFPGQTLKIEGGHNVFTSRCDSSHKRRFISMDRFGCGNLGRRAADFTRYFLAAGKITCPLAPRSIRNSPPSLGPFKIPPVMNSW